MAEAASERGGFPPLPGSLATADAHRQGIWSRKEGGRGGQVRRRETPRGERSDCLGSSGEVCNSQWPLTAGPAIHQDLRIWKPDPESDRSTTIFTLVDSKSSKRVNQPSAFGGLTERKYVSGVRPLTKKYPSAGETSANLGSRCRPAGESRREKSVIGLLS